jgi:hypothetical protein
VRVDTSETGHSKIATRDRGLLGAQSAPVVRLSVSSEESMRKKPRNGGAFYKRPDIAELDGLRG